MRSTTLEQERAPSSLASRVTPAAGVSKPTVYCPPERVEACVEEARRELSALNER